MNKYLTVYKLEFMHFLEYRSEFIAEFISIFVKLFLGLFFTLAIYENKTDIFSYSINDFATYFLLSAFVGKLIETDVNWVFEEQIRKGKLAIFLIKPINFNKSRLVSELSWKSHSTIYGLLVISLIAFIYSRIIMLRVIPSRIVFFLLATTIGYFLNRAIKLIIGSLTFWTKYIGGISHFISQVINILGGQWLPIEFFGPFLKYIRLLPFSYIYYFPIQILIREEINNFDIVKIIALELVWTILFHLLFILLWKKGIKHFESVGI